MHSNNAQGALPSNLEKGPEQLDLDGCAMHFLDEIANPRHRLAVMRDEIRSNQKNSRAERLMPKVELFDPILL